MSVAKCCPYSADYENCKFELYSGQLKFNKCSTCDRMKKLPLSNTPKMVSKEEVLEKFRVYGVCRDILCENCPYGVGTGLPCTLHNKLVRLGAKIMLEKTTDGIFKEI